MTVRTGPSEFPSAVAYIVRRDVAKALVVPFGVVPRDEPGDLGLQSPRRLPHHEVHLLLVRPVMARVSA